MLEMGAVEQDGMLVLSDKSQDIDYIRKLFFERSAECEQLHTELATARARIAELEADLAFARSQRDDNENAWQCGKTRIDQAAKLLAAKVDSYPSELRRAARGALAALKGETP